MADLDLYSIFFRWLLIQFWSLCTQSEVNQDGRVPPAYFPASNFVKDAF